MEKLYPGSHAIMTGVKARFYDRIMDILLLGSYRKFITDAISRMGIKPGQHVLDLGCGTGRNARIIQQHTGSTGSVTGYDISNGMISQFRRVCRDIDNIHAVQARIDKHLPYSGKCDAVFMSFVLHSLPHQSRLAVLDNCLKVLRSKGKLCILDYNENSLSRMPPAHALFFKCIECPLAFDFISRDWSAILKNRGFDIENKFFWINKFVRLIIARRN